MDTISVSVFAATLLATLFVAYLGRQHDARRARGGLANQGLNRWLIGLSAGATANSGFVVTAAVGLGYSYGVRWLLLPLAWLLGDIFFWIIFPHRINQAGASAQATTITDVLTSGLPQGPKRLLQRLVGVIILACLGGYVSAQWVAGEKFLGGAFGMSQLSALIAFAAVIIVYSALGGFRGSVYADTLQATIRIVGTAVAAIAIWVVATRDPATFAENIRTAGSDFLSLMPDGYLLAAGSTLGFAAAALGFGLGQPQIVTRYFAGATPKETQSAWWIYMLFVQSTWLVMTAFGVALRGVMPELADPETGLSVFHRTTTGPVITGIIAADIFATIAATSNSILVAMGQTITFDLLSGSKNPAVRNRDLWGPIAAVGLITMAFSLVMHSTVLNLALSSVALMGAGLAPAMIVRVLGWRHTATSLIASVLVGLGVATLWRLVGLGGIVNEAAPGIAAGLLGNWAAAALAPTPTRTASLATE
jgi:sodium/proline symporter